MSGTVLFISPDYASHYYPMSAVGAVLMARGFRVVFATGDALRGPVRADGFDFTPLVLGPGSNSGVMRTKEQSSIESERMDAFFDATKKGMIPTLKFQAESRLRDLLHEPQWVAAELEGTLSLVNPDVVVADHLAFGATAALRGLGQNYIGFHPGHPSAIPTSLPYGFPPRIPMRIRVEEAGLAALRELCRGVASEFTGQYNEVISRIDPGGERVEDAFAAVSPAGTLVNYPSALGKSYGLATSVRFMGSAVRRSILSHDLASSLEGDRSRPRIYVSLGSFFSARSDLLKKIVAAFRREPVEVVMAHGVTPPNSLGDIPSHWTIAEHLPQPAVISKSSLVVTHGGNNTVTESLAAGVPLLVGPLSTDQFAAAADIETAQLGRVFDPNHDDADTIADLAHQVLTHNAAGADAIGQSLRARPGQVLAADFIESSLRSTSRR